MKHCKQLFESESLMWMFDEKAVYYREYGV